MGCVAARVLYTFSGCCKRIVLIHHRVSPLSRVSHSIRLYGIDTLSSDVSSVTCPRSGEYSSREDCWRSREGMGFFCLYQSRTIGSVFTLTSRSTSFFVGPSSTFSTPSSTFALYAPLQPGQ